MADENRVETRAIETREAAAGLPGQAPAGQRQITRTPGMGDVPGLRLTTSDRSFQAPTAQEKAAGAAQNNPALRGANVVPGTNLAVQVATPLVSDQGSVKPLQSADQKKKSRLLEQLAFMGFTIRQGLNTVAVIPVNQGSIERIPKSLKESRDFTGAVQDKQLIRKYFDKNGDGRVDPIELEIAKDKFNKKEAIPVLGRPLTQDELNYIMEI